MERKGEPIQWYFFDSDDNLMHVSTLIYLFHRQTGEERAITTHEYALHRTQIANPEDPVWGVYELRMAPESGSFRDFQDENNSDVFIRDVQNTIEQLKNSYLWRGPAWMAYVMAINNPVLRPFVGMITTRGHHSKNIIRAYELAVEAGLVSATPREEMVFGIHAPGLNERFIESGIPQNHNPERKLTLIFELLDLANSISLKNSQKHHSFGYSDDDLHMITYIRNNLYEEMMNGRWPHLHIHIFSTGPGSEFRDVLTPKGMYRKR